MKEELESVQFRHEKKGLKRNYNARFNNALMSEARDAPRQLGRNGPQAIERVSL